MAKFGAWNNAFISIAGVSLGDHCETFDPNETRRVLDFDAHGDTAGLKTGGLKDITLSARFYGDFAAASVNQTLRPLFDNATPAPVIIKPASGATALTNPQWSGNFFISKFSPMKGRHGDVLMTEVEFAPLTDLTYSET